MFFCVTFEKTKLQGNVKERGSNEIANRIDIDVLEHQWPLKVIDEKIYNDLLLRDCGFHLLAKTDYSTSFLVAMILYCKIQM